MGEEKETGSIEAEGWGAKFKASGIDTKIVLVALLVVVCLLWATYQLMEQRGIDRNARDSFVTQHKITQGMLEKLSASNEAIITLLKDVKEENKDNKDEVSFILTRTQQQREALKLEMPQSLRRKINER